MRNVEWHVDAVGNRPETNSTVTSEGISSLPVKNATTSSRAQSTCPSINKMIRQCKSQNMSS